MDRHKGKQSKDIGHLSHEVTSGEKEWVEMVGGISVKSFQIKWKNDKNSGNLSLRAAIATREHKVTEHSNLTPFSF